MSRAQKDSQVNEATNQFLNRVTNAYIRGNSINETSTTLPITDDNDERASTWVDAISYLDNLFSASVLRLCYNLIDMILLSIGLSYKTKKCNTSNTFVIISICILFSASAALTNRVILFIQNLSVRNRNLSDAERMRRCRQMNILYGIFQCFKFISVCVGTAYVFTSKKSMNNDCEPIRFYLAIVCFSTWVLLIIWPPKASLPIRRSLLLEFFIVFLSCIFSISYIVSLLFVTVKTKSIKCIYNDIGDLYYRAPLKSFAYGDIILIGSAIGITMLHAILNQLYFRFLNLRKFLNYLSAINYAVSCLIVIIIIYYFSVGIFLLFQPRSGGECGILAPDLYKTLWIWQLIRIFLPLAIWPLVFLFCCLGITFGACIAACLPASVTVPLLELLRERLPNTPNISNENPPASPGTIEALPKVVFGEASDEFNQTECVICRFNYQPNEEIKRLPCGHVFHTECVSRWLSMTRICPVCRQRIPTLQT